jgi:DNA-directed RNA polymerase subunit RPC12/RpoP
MGSRYDDRDDELDDLPRFKGRSGVECHRCGCTDPPVVRSQVSQAGWITLILMILFCWPLFWIGLLMTEEYHQCSDCGVRL